MSSEKLAIVANGISKCYQIYDSPKDRLKQFLARGRRQYFREFWALRPISFTVERGECIGFIGRNGSGKSTLLQMLAGTLNPTSGTLQCRGRIAALLELGAGFNPEFTGRENTYLNAAILGLSRQEVTEKLPSILEFAEIGDFLDQPVKTYSSGMYVRLAFSVAIHLDPEILIVDEALAVGDAAFQYKCLTRIEEMQKSGMSIVFVTHDTGAVRRLCDRAGWIHDGQLVSLGDAVDVAHQYESFLREKMRLPTEEPAAVAAAPEPTAADESRSHAEILDVALIDAKGAPTSATVTGADVRLRIRYRVTTASSGGLVIGGAVFRNDNLYVCGLNTGLDNFWPDSSPGEHTLDLHYPRFPLLAGAYYYKVGIFDKTGSVRWDFSEHRCPFTVTSPYVGEGVVLLDHTWLQESADGQLAQNAR